MKTDPKQSDPRHRRDDSNYNNLLPSFLMTEIAKEENPKESVLWYGDREDDALEIQLDNYLNNKPNNNCVERNFFQPPSDPNTSFGSGDHPQPIKNKWNSDKILPKYHNQLSQTNFIPSNYQAGPTTFSYQRYNSDTAGTNYQMNMNNNNSFICQFSQGPHQILQNNQKNQHFPQNIPNRINHNNYMFQPNNYQRYQNIQYNCVNNNNNSYNSFESPGNNFNYNIFYPNNGKLNPPNFPSNYHFRNNSPLEPNLYHFEQPDFRIASPLSPHSNSTNISAIEDSINSLKINPSLKKNNSEKYLKGRSSKKKDTLKSLFKEKNEESVFHGTELDTSSKLNEILSKNPQEIVNFIRTQKGSRVMQKELNMIAPSAMDRLIEVLGPFLNVIMNDTYGNYFSQRLIQSCTAEQRLRILQLIQNDFVSISINQSGTHSVQCLIEIINLKEEEEVIKEAIKNDILKLAYDSNSTHVLQKTILMIDEKNREHINKTLLDNLLTLVLDPNGICVIKKLVNGNKEKSIQNSILKVIEEHCLEIIQSPYGNYIIQHVLDEWGYMICKDIVKVIYQNLISLSMQKFASNVVEKCLDMIDHNTKKLWVKELFNFSKLSSLMKNKYGNFVLQKSLQSMSNIERAEIKENILKKMDNLSNKEKPRIMSLLDLLD